MNYKLKEIAQMCDGTVFGDGEKVIKTLFLDSREEHENALFVPIVGEKVDAHKFIDALFQKGVSSFSMHKIDNAMGDYILVEDTVVALQKFANNHRKKMNIPVIGITGSVGKTTTKEIVSLAIENQVSTLKTLGNANSQIGLPLTLLRIEKEHEVAIIEMGMSLKGEMEKLTNCAMPNYAVFTNVGVSHIEFHRTKENIMKEKLHITDKFSQNSILFVNGDDQLLKTLKENLSFKVIEFGLGENCDYRATDIVENENGTSFSCLRNGEKIPMTLSVLGEHNIRNALTALAVSETLNLSTEKSVKSISSYTPPEMRQQILKTENCTIIDDTYNASPDSMKCAIDVLCKLKGRKIAILSDVLEMGDYSEKGHREVGEYAKKMNIDFLLTFGKESRYINIAFNDEEKSRHFLEYNEAEAFLKNYVKTGDCVLVKGSRGMKTDRFVKALRV
ncbi:MAG: UDP-N-acetylmuramoyl-tripeptide--D-alanyl-D-alanine ligase [Clostridia bacterium]